jgi:hypothetical protein
MSREEAESIICKLATDRDIDTGEPLIDPAIAFANMSDDEVVAEAWALINTRDTELRREARTWKRFSAVQVTNGWIVTDGQVEGTLEDATYRTGTTGRKMLPTNRAYAEKLAALLNEREGK